MATDPNQDAVRPLTVGHRPRARVSRATLVVLLLTGGIIGYFFGLPTAGPVAAEPAISATTPTTLPPVGGSAPTPAHYDWVEQNPANTVQQAWGVFAAVELDDVLYLLVYGDRDSPEDRVLWRSDDGKVWTEIPLDLGDAAVHDLDVYGDALMLSGWLDGAPAVWQSQPNPATEPNWDVTRLGVAPQHLGDVRILESSVQTEINASGEVLVSVRTQTDIAPLLLEFAGEPDALSVLRLPGQPVIAASGQRLWAKVVAADETESVHSIELPPTTVLEPASGSYVSVGLITAGSLWASPDGSVFMPVDLSALPRAPMPRAIADGFISVVEDPTGGFGLWTTPDGVTWSPNPAQPPIECGDLDGLVVGGPGMLLISDSFDTTCVSTNGADWLVRDSARTALSTTGQVWAEGADNGFLALARNAQEVAVLISANGLDWQPVEFATGLLGTHTFLVGDRLITNAITYGPPPLGRRFSVWVGDPREN